MAYQEFGINKESFRHIDSYHDSFAKIKNVQTDLLYGDRSIDATPFLSVLIPTYSRAAFFREALESVLRQEDPGCCWEIIVVDNTPLTEQGNTPALEIVQDINCERVLFYHNRENIGAGYNWNRGVELARGEWVSFLHDDDLLLPDALRNIFLVIQRYKDKLKNLGFIRSRAYEFSGKFDHNKAIKRSKKYLQVYTRLGALIKGGPQTNAPTCGTTILKKAYIETGGINYDYGACADQVLGYQIMKDYSVIHLGCVTGGYRWSDNASTRKDVIISMVESDYFFSLYRYSVSFWSKLFGKLFWRVELNRNICSKQGIARRSNFIIEEHDFTQLPMLKKNFFLSIFIYRSIQQVYHQLEKIWRLY